MAANHAMDGLIKWVHREEWIEVFEDVLARHTDAACRAAGVEFEDLSKIIGNIHVGNLWGCALEDLISSGSDEDNVTVDYLKRRGWKESAGTRAHLNALRRSTISLYEVSGIVPGESFLARDLVRGGDPVRVVERTATRMLKPWDRIGGRVITFMGKTLLSGGLLVFDHKLADRVLTVLQATVDEASAISDETGVDSSNILEAVLAESAFLFSSLWLDDTLRRALNPTRPVLQNSDGDPIDFITLHLPIASRKSLRAVRAALDALPELRKADDGFWNWLETGTPRSAPAENTPGVETISTKMDDGAVVLGNVEIVDAAVIVSVNSQARLERSRALLEPALAGLVGASRVERRAVEDGIAGSENGSAQPPAQPPLSAAEAVAVTHKLLTDHYRTTLDEPIPALGNRTPRLAVETKAGRDDVVAWLKMIENATRRADPADPMSSYDFVWMWEELGVADRRR